MYFALSLLLGALGVLAAAVFSAASAATGVGFPVPTRAETASFSLTDVKTITLGAPADQVAVYWRGDKNAHVTLAFSSDGIDFSAPVDAGRDDNGEETQGGMTYGEVQVADGAVAVRVATDVPLAQFNVLGLSSTDGVGSRLASAGGPVVPAGDQPTIISRTGWGADPKYLNWAPEFYPATKVIVHHTADNIGAAGTQDYYANLVRSIYYYHAVTQGWGDIAYNFLIDPLGNIYEGRYSDVDNTSPGGEDIFGNGVIGGHTYGCNTGTIGIAVLGTYSSKDISAAARASLETLIAWEATRNGIDPSGWGPYDNPFNTSPPIQTYNIAGHRDYRSTDCPGTAFYNSLPIIRQDVVSLTGPITTPTPYPTYLLLAASPKSPTGGEEVTITATLLEESSHMPLPGRTVSFATSGIAAASTFLGSAVTDSDGVASLQTTFTTAGMHWVTARYDPAGNADYRGSTTSCEADVSPSGLSATPGGSQVQLLWNASTGAGGYNVYRDGVKINTALLAFANYLDTGLNNGVTYSYQVTAVVNGRESARSPVVSATPVVSMFSDVPISYPYYQAVHSLADAGIVNGKTDGKFYPDEPVTRQQFAKMIVLGGGYPVSESDVCPFKDVTRGGATTLYPDNYVAVCAARGITLGKSATTFDPYTNITRAQVLSMVVRAALDFKPSAVQEPPAGWKDVLPVSDPTHGLNTARAEYSGFLVGIDLSKFSVSGKATRGEIAQIIWNVEQK